ncbi:ervatamin-B-like [Lolium rigidum]|uniref:ervatamin-B-like n=1 Tax=Lolium rigidum TaxID=89674 RepID=UPI001F5C34E3|nr:ervatamin-B-like [Lolium rigidum]
MGRLLSRRFFSQAAAAAGSLSSRTAGARLQVRLQSQRRSVSDAATGAGNRRRLGFLGRIVIRSVSCIYGLSLWFPEEIEEQAEKYARPSQIDWVEAGVVSPVVRSQKDCGCCWAMAIVASVEAAHYMRTLRPISLSVQELLDCNRTNNGCEGGSTLRALWYIWRNGLSSDSSYPYMAQRSISGCKRDKTVAARISGYEFVDQNEDALEKAVAKQPVVVILKNTANLENYKGGIMEYEAFPPTVTNEGHLVLVVGYGMDSDGNKYWRFKNSWGEGWGEGGFGRIRRHVADKRGVSE